MENEHPKSALLAPLFNMFCVTGTCLLHGRYGTYGLELSTISGIHLFICASYCKWFQGHEFIACAYPCSQLFGIFWHGLIRLQRNGLLFS
eukprot:5472852-Amphidinium_carterae.3